MLSKPRFYPKAWLWKAALRPRARTRQDSKLWCSCRFISWYNRICMQPGTMGVLALLILQRRLIPLSWGPAWFIGRKNTYCIFTDFLKSSCKDVFKNLCSLSFFDHMNHHMKRSWRSSVMTLNWRKLPALRPGSHQLQGTRLCFIREKSLHTPKDVAEMKSSNYLDIAEGSWLAGCFHEALFKSDLPEPQNNKAQLK